MDQKITNEKISKFLKTVGSSTNFKKFLQKTMLDKKVQSIFPVNIWSFSYAQVYVEMVPKVQNLLFITLTTCFCKTIQHVAKFGEIRQRTSNKNKGGGLK